MYSYVLIVWILSNLCSFSECGLINKTCTKTDIDLIFARAKPKTGRKLEWKHFEQALAYVAEKRFPTTFKSSGSAAAVQKVHEAIAASSGPGKESHIQTNMYAIIFIDLFNFANQPQY